MPPLNEEAKNQVRGHQQPPETEMVQFDFCFSCYKAALKTTLCFTGLKQQSAKLKMSLHQTPWYGTHPGAATGRPASGLGKYQLLHQRWVSWRLGGCFPPARSAACSVVAARERRVTRGVEWPTGEERSTPSRAAVEHWAALPHNPALKIMHQTQGLACSIRTETSHVNW